MKIRIPSLTKIDTTPTDLEIGSCGECSEEIYLQGVRETQQIRGMLTFADGSKEWGTREIELGEVTLRMNGNELQLEGLMFQPWEYYGL